MISVPSGGISKAVYFPIVPTRIGEIFLSIVAQSAKAGDAVEQILKVEVIFDFHIFLISYSFIYEISKEKKTFFSA